MMSYTRSQEDNLTESWVDLSISPGRLTPVSVNTMSLINNHGVREQSQSSNNMVSGNGGMTSYSFSLSGEECLRMLRDAQRESNHSSALVSLASSRRDSRCDSPKSPPNSPNNELSTEDDELKGIFINKEGESTSKPQEWILSYWTAKCDSKKQDQHGFRPKVTITSKGNLSLRTAKIGGKGLFSREVMYTLFVSNFLSLIIGAGIGLWLSKRSPAIANFH